VIAYDKGYFFLRLIEETTGRERFDAFLNKYFANHAFQVMDTDKFLAYLNTHLITPEEAKTIDIDAWVFGQRIPENIPVVKSARLDAVDQKTEDWNSGRIKAIDVPWNTWGYQERYRFLKNLKDAGSASYRLGELDMAFNITNTGNYEVLFVWLEQSIQNDYKPAFDRAEAFLIEMAVRIYAKARPGYHAVARQTMDELLGKPI